MGILSDDIMEVESATANWRVIRHGFNSFKQTLIHRYSSHEQDIAERLNAIPILELTDEKIIKACEDVIKPSCRGYFTLKFDEDNRVWLYAYKPTKYSQPVGFVLTTNT